MDILTQLNLAMAYIEEHLEDDLALSDISRVTAYSPYHFGRLFYYIADMPLPEYIRRRKLSLAAMALQISDVKVIDLAVRYGYESADSFTRAFVKQHGVTPSAARQSGVSLTIFPPISFQIRIKGVQAMNWRIEEKDAFEVFGIERIFDTFETRDIAGFWDQCFQNNSYDKLFDDAGGTRMSDGHGYPRDDGACTINAVCGYSELGDNKYPYLLCALKKADSKTSGYTVIQVPKNTWAVFKSNETDWAGGEFPNLYSQAYSEWLPNSAYNRASGPDMELYYGFGKQIAELWIPVKKV